MTTKKHPWQKWETVKPEPPIGEVDLGGPKRRKFNRDTKHYKDEQKVLMLVKKLLPDLFKLNVCPNYSEEDINDILLYIYEEFSGHSLRYFHNFFIKGLDKFNRDNKCKIPVPAPLSIVHRQPSPFKYENYHKLHLIKPLVEQFDLSLEKPIFFSGESVKDTKRKYNQTNAQACNQLDVWIGQIIFSSIYKGALLEVRLVYALLEYIEKRNLIVENEYVWFDFKITKTKNSENKILRRWFPDSVSGLLILRLLNVMVKKGNEKFTTQCYKTYAQDCFKTYLKSLGLKVSEQPSINQFIKISSVNLNLYLPPYLVQFATNINHSISLNAETWIRLRENRQLKINKEATENDKTQAEKTDISNICAVTKLSYKKTSNNQTPKLIELERILSGFNNNNIKPDYAVAKNNITKWLKRNYNLSPLMQALSQWCLELLTDRPDRRKSRASTTNNYLSNIGRPLILRIGNNPLTDFKLKDWEAIYASILTNSKNTDIKAYLLVNFHNFLVKRYDIVNIEIEYSGNKISRIPNVNILTLQEYKNTFNQLGKNRGFSGRLKTIQQLLLIIGYRCGLRKSESITLRVKDLQTVYDPLGNKSISDLRPELLVVSNRYAKVKLNYSMRRLSLSLFLNDLELRLLLDWKQRRLRELSNTSIKNQLLFCNVGEDYTPLLTKETATQIQKTMRFVTGDNQLRFHHLRHSFANFSLLKLLSSNNENLIPNNWIDKKNELANLPVNLTPQLILLSANGVSRRLLYALSTSCGHIDPGETIQTYIHLLDWILIHELRKYEQPISFAAQANLLDVNINSLRTIKSRKKISSNLPTALLKKTTNKYIRKYADINLKNTKQGKSIPKMFSNNNHEEKYPSPLVLYSIFHRYYQNKNISLVSQQLGFKDTEIKHWVKNAKKISNAKSARKKHSKFVRANYELLTTEQLNMAPTLHGLCPAPPKLALDKEDAKEIYYNLLSYYEKHSKDLLIMLRKYWERASLEKSFYIPRNDPKDKEQKLLIKLLNAMSIKKNRYRVDFTPNPNKSSKKQIKHWMEVYNLKNENFHIKPCDGDTQNKNGKARIWISQKGKKFNSDEKDSYEANQSIRFALYMVMIIITP